MTTAVSVTPRPLSLPLLLDAQAPAGKGTPLETQHRQTCRWHPQRVGGDQLSPSSDLTARGGARSWALRETGPAHSPGLPAEPASPQARVCRPLNQPREGRACEAAAAVQGARTESSLSPPKPPPACTSAPGPGEPHVAGAFRPGTTGSFLSERVQKR